jgi:hypothetical protein
MLVVVVQVSILLVQQDRVVLVVAVLVVQMKHRVVQEQQILAVAVAVVYQQVPVEELVVLVWS